MGVGVGWGGGGRVRGGGGEGGGGVTKRLRLTFPWSFATLDFSVIIPFFQPPPGSPENGELGPRTGVGPGLLLSHEAIIDRLRQSEVVGVSQLVYVTWVRLNQGFTDVG